MYTRKELIRLFLVFEIQPISDAYKGVEVCESHTFLRGWSQTLSSVVTIARKFFNAKATPALGVDPKHWEVVALISRKLFK